MALPLFWRLTLGYAAILLLSVGTSIYAIVQLSELSQTARVALETDYRTIAQQETLTDAFLSEVRYGGKYLLTQSPSSYDQFRQFKNDFLRYLSELKAAGTSAETSTQLVRVEHLHQSFHDLFEQESRYLKAGQPYAQSRYQQERDKILDNTLRELARLKDQLETNVHDKLGRLGGTARAARNIAIATTLILLIVGTALSLGISTSVTKPLVALTSRSKNESADMNGILQLSSIPEIQELAEVLARQKQRLRRAAIDNSSRMEQVTEELAARATSLKRQLNELKANNDSVMTPQGRASIATLIGDTDGLVQYCAEINAAAAARTEVMKLAPQTAEQLKAEPTMLGTDAWLIRELPDTAAATQSASTPIAARWANIFAPLVRQLRRHKNDTDKQDR
jgi:hypothetical protein